MSLRFPTGTDFISVAAAASINDMASGSIFATVYATSFATIQVILAKGPANFVFRIETSGAVSWSIARATTGLSIVPSTVLSTGTWYDIGVTWDTAGVNGDQRMYYGAVGSAMTEVAYTTQLVGSGAVTSNAANALRIGTASTGSNPFVTGGIDRVRLYNTKFDLTSATLNFNALRTRSRSFSNTGCVLDFDLGRIGGATAAIDLSNSGNAGTASGTPVLADPAPRGARYRGAPRSSMANYVAPVVGTGSSKRTNRRRRAHAALFSDRGV